MIPLNRSVKALYILTFLGIADAVYLTIAKYYHLVLFCPTVGVINCAGVIGSQYSTVFGIPISILGAILFVLVPFMMIKGNDTYRFVWSIAGAGSVIYSISAMALLGEACEYCLLLDLSILLVIVLTYHKVSNTIHIDGGKNPNDK